MGGNMSGGEGDIEDNESEVHLEGTVDKALIVKAVRKSKQAGNNPVDAQDELSHDEDDDKDDDDNVPDGLPLANNNRVVCEKGNQQENDDSNNDEDDEDDSNDDADRLPHATGNGEIHKKGIQ